MSANTPTDRTGPEPDEADEDHFGDLNGIGFTLGDPDAPDEPDDEEDDDLEVHDEATA